MKVRQLCAVTSVLFDICQFTFITSLLGEAVWGPRMNTFNNELFENIFIESSVSAWPVTPATACVCHPSQFSGTVTLLMLVIDTNPSPRMTVYGNAKCFKPGIHLSPVTLEAESNARSDTDPRLRRWGLLKLCQSWSLLKLLSFSDEELGNFRPKRGQDFGQFVNQRPGQAQCGIEHHSTSTKWW